MGWRDELRTASFKGIKFHVSDHESTHGRRLAVNEYPYRDIPYTEDMGRKANRWNVTAYLVGDDYTATRDNLLEAIEAGGIGTLVHPYYGTKQVYAEEARARETNRDGGYVEISINFVEAGSKTFPNSAPIPAKLTISSADSLISIAQGIFENAVTLEGVSEYVRTSFADGLTGATDIFTQIQNVGGINVQSTVSKINQAAEWVASLAELADPTNLLFGDIAGIGNRLVSLFKGVFDLGGSKKDISKNLAKFATYTAPTSTAATAQGETINENAAALERFVRTVALANESKALVGTTYDSYDEAVATRKYILARIDTVSGDAVDEEYDALQSLRKQIGQAIPAEGQNLPIIGHVTLGQSSPALVLAYDLYNSVARESDIVARNKIRHPGFLPGGAELEVLNDA